MTFHIIIYRWGGVLHNGYRCILLKMIERTVRRTQHFEIHEPAGYDILSAFLGSLLLKEMSSNFLLSSIIEIFPN